MAQYYLINPVLIGGVQFLPGELIDSTVRDTTQFTNAGALLWAASDATVAAAATVAQNAHIQKGASAEAMLAIMQAAVDASQAATSDVLTERVLEDAAGAIQKKSVTIAAADIAALGAVMSGAINIGTVLPASARLLGCQVNVGTKVQNAGDTDTTTVDIGVAGQTDAAAKSVTLKTTGLKGMPPTSSATGFVGENLGAAQLIATLTSSVNLSTITAGAVTIEVFYFVLA